MLGVGGGHDGDRGAVVYIIGIRSAGSDDVGGAGAGGVDLNLGDAVIADGNAVEIGLDVAAALPCHDGGHKGGLGVHGATIAVLAVELDAVDGVAVYGIDGDGGCKMAALAIPSHVAAAVGQVIAFEGDGGHAVEGLAAAGEAAVVAGVDGGQHGLSRGHDGLEGAAVGLGEGEGGLGVEGGQEVFAAAGHDEGVAAGVVAHGVVVVDGAEVVRRVGRGGDADGQAFHDAVGAVTGLSDAVGHLGLGAGGRAGDGPIVGTSPFKFARIIAAVFEGTADADSDPIVASVAYAHAFVHLVVCIGKGDIGIIAEGGVVGQAAGGDGKRPVVSGAAFMFEGDVVEGVNSLAVELNGAVALFGEGEGVVFGVDGHEALAAGEIAEAAEVAVGVVVVLVVGPEGEVPALAVVIVGDEAEGAVGEGRVVVEYGRVAADSGAGVGDEGLYRLDGHADMRSEDDAVVEHGLDDLVGARHEEVPVAGELVKGRDGGVGGNVDAGEEDVCATVVGYNPGVAVLAALVDGSEEDGLRDNNGDRVVAAIASDSASVSDHITVS